MTEPGRWSMLETVEVAEYPMQPDKIHQHGHEGKPVDNLVMECAVSWRSSTELRKASP